MTNNTTPEFVHGKIYRYLQECFVFDGKQVGFSVGFPINQISDFWLRFAEVSLVGYQNGQYYQ